MLPVVLAALLAVRVNVVDASCGDRAAVEARLADRSVAVTKNEGEEALDVEIGARATADGAEASFALHGAAGTTMRTIRAATCAEALDALAFALAISVERTEEPPAPPSPPPVRLQDVTQPAARLRVGGGASLGAMLGVAPSALVTLGANVHLDSSAVFGWSPALRLGVVFALPHEESILDRPIAFSHQGGTLDGCPVRFGTRAFGLRPCVRIQAGRLQARSEEFAGARLANRAWVAAGALLEASVDLVASLLYISAELGIAVPLVRDDFVLGSQQVFEVPPLAGSGALGLGVRFW